MSCGWLGQLFTVVKKTGGPLILALIVVNIVMLVSGLLISIPYPALLSSVIIAYTLGLRHAVDADHLAAIDNVTRKLVSEGQKPVTVGLFFSLGHSTIVFALSCFVAISASLVSEYFPEAQEVGDILGTTISASFLLLIGFINLYCLIKLTIEWRAFNREKKLKVEVSKEIETLGEENEENEETKGGRENKTKIGFCNSLCPTLINIVDKPYKMYFVGFLFGLGFDTASEVALLSMAAVAPDEGVPPWLVLILPLVFASGMALIDTTDGIMMIWAYGWAFVEPEKKFFYNFFVTTTSLLIALLIGGLEVLSIFATIFELDGPFWNFVAKINYETVGYLIIALFITCLLVGVISYRIRFGSKKTSNNVSRLGEIGNDTEDVQLHSAEIQSIN